jgi:hypothetical protein
MSCLRTADQFIHTGLEKADEAHQEAHVLLEKWEKFALRLDQRRKLLSIIVSFYKQTEEASERLSQIEREIQIEQEKIKNIGSNSDEEIHNIKVNTSQQKHSSTSSLNRNENAQTNELQQRHANLSNQLAEISGRGLREARIVLEKISKDDFESKHVIKKVRLSLLYIYPQSRLNLI